MRSASPRRIGNTSLVVTGTAAAAFATGVTHLWLTGFLPATLMPQRTWLGTLREIGGVPIEFAVFTAFVALWAMSGSKRDVGSQPVAFLVQVLALGTALGIAWSSPRAVPLWICGACALGLLLKDQAGRPTAESLFRLLRQAGTTTLEPETRRRLLVMVLCVVVLAQFLAARTASVGRSEAERRQLLRWYEAGLHSAAPSLRSKAGTHRIVVYSDYQCPFCRAHVPQYRAIAEGHRQRGARVSFEVRDFPLARECNSIANVTIHPLACEMAAGARLVRARRPDEADRFDAWLYQLPDDATLNDIMAQLNRLGLSGEFTRSGEQLLADVKADAASGSALGVYSTPTMFVNGVRLPPVTPVGFQALLDSLVGLTNQD